MTNKPSIFERTTAVFAMLGAASAVASAVEAHRTPGARDLKRLGINPAAFDNIRL